MTARRRAMTLLEVMLAVAILVGMMGAVYSFYRGVLASRDRIVLAAAQAAGQRVAMARITAELRSARTIPVLKVGLKGDADRMSFAAAVLPGPGVWNPRGSGRTVPGPQHDLQLVGYRLRTVEGPSGETQFEGLERTCQRAMTAREAEEGKEIEVSLLTPHVKYLRLRYWDGSGWLDGWGGGDLPGAVEITLGFAAGDEGGEAPEQTSRRVVYVPTGAKAARGAVLRGLDRGAGL